MNNLSYKYKTSNSKVLKNVSLQKTTVMQNYMDATKPQITVSPMVNICGASSLNHSS